VSSPTLIVSTPSGRTAERNYILDTILAQFLGLPFRVEERGSQVVTLAVEGSEGHIEIPDLLFSSAEKDWMTSAFLPDEPVPRLDHGDDYQQVPAFYSDNSTGPVIVNQGDSLKFQFDVLGSCFYMLTRCEEHMADPSSLDAHGRFPATSSLLYRENLLERPIVDEYLELLRSSINRLWPELVSQPDEYKLMITHDIDHPLSTYGQTLKLVMRRTMGDLVRRRDLLMGYRRLKAYIRDDADGDPNNTFNWLMDRSEDIGARSRFHFMAATPTRYDSGYDIGARQLQPILVEISARNHEIGIHPSYRSSVDTSLFSIEKERLERALKAAAVATWSHTSRQHYLRWSARSTWSHLDAVGIKIDSSVGFADAPGFRCGTSRQFKTFDLEQSRTLGLVEQPLIVMDATLTGKRYLGLDWEESIEKTSELAATCKRHGAPFTLLWHNDKVLTRTEKQQYLQILQATA
jgi:hypothetical protein